MSHTMKFSTIIHGETRTVLHVSDETCAADPKWYFGYISDCFDPPITAVRAGSWEEAYEAFTELPHVVRDLEIPEDCLNDYDEDNLRWSDTGIPVDTDGVYLVGPGPLFARSSR